MTARTPSPVAATALVAMLVWLGWPPSAAAQREAAEARIEVAALELHGVEAIDEELLREVIRTKPGGWLPWADERYFDRETFEADLRRIVAFYRDQGFPDARVVSHDVDIDSGESKARVTIRIEEGEPFVVDAIVLSGFDPLSPEAQEDLRKRMPIDAGDRVVHVRVVESGEMAAQALSDRGHPYAQVEVRESRAGPRALGLEFAARPGPPATFGEIEVTGNRTVDDDIIRRELRYRPGQRFERRLLQESQQDLYRLGLFRFANIEIVDAERRPTEVVTRVTVVEGKHSQVEASLGYGTEEKARAKFTWRNVNFLGGARTLAVQTAWSSLNRGAQIDLVQPYLFHPRLSLQLDAHYWREDEPSFDLTARGGRAALIGDVDARSTVSLTWRSENQASQVAPAALADPTLRDELIALGLNPDTGRQGGWLHSLTLSGQRSTADNPLNPQKGYLASASVEYAGGVLPGVFDFLLWDLAGRHYLPVGTRVVVASRLRVATIDPSGTSADLPFAQRFFLGGSTSLRGWGRFEVSPLSANGLPIGGKSLVEATAEVRARVRGNLGGVVFVDAGNVWRDEWQFELGDVLADAGVGLRYFTPVGPVRLDLAWQLTPTPDLVIDGQPQTRRWRLHFSIGQAF